MQSSSPRVTPQYSAGRSRIMLQRLLWRIGQARSTCRYPTLEQTIKCDGPVEPSDFFGKPIGPKQVAHPPARSDDAQCNTARLKLCMEPMQHARAGKIDVR